MLKHNFLVYICLLSAPSLFCNGNHIHEPLTSPMEFTKEPLLASERHGDTFAVVDYQEHDYYSNYDNKTVVDMSLRIENWKNQSVKECRYSFELHRPNSFNIRSFERLKGTDDKVVLHWGYFLGNSGGAFVMDFRTCFMTFFGPKDEHYQLMVMPTNAGGLDVFVNHETYCKDAGESCVIRYDSSLRLSGKPKPVDIDLYWPMSRVDQLHNGNYLVHGAADRFTHYKALLLDSSTGYQKNLYTMNSHSAFVHSGSSFCWMNRPFFEKIIHCSRFNDKGELIFNKTLTFDVCVKLVFMHELADGELFVLNYDSQYVNAGDIWTMQWTKIAQDSGETDFGYVEFNCTGRIVLDTFVVYDFWQSGEKTYLGYACRNGDRYVYDVTSF